MVPKRVRFFARDRPDRRITADLDQICDGSVRGAFEDRCFLGGLETLVGGRSLQKRRRRVAPASSTVWRSLRWHQETAGDACPAGPPSARARSASDAPNAQQLRRPAQQRRLPILFVVKRRCGTMCNGTRDHAAPGAQSRRLQRYRKRTAPKCYTTCSTPRPS